MKRFSCLSCTRAGLLAAAAICLLTACSPADGLPPAVTAPTRVVALPTTPAAPAETPAETSAAAYVLYELPSPYAADRPHRVDVSELARAKVERVVDGDTLVVRLDGTRDRLRMLGINAPESSSNPDLNRQTPEGDIVSALVRELLTDRTVRLEFDESPRDQYGRLLAYVWLDENTMLNENLVFSGLVKVVKFPPNTAYYDYFRSLNRAARERGLGFYADRWR